MKFNYSAMGLLAFVLFSCEMSTSEKTSTVNTKDTSEVTADTTQIPEVKATAILTETWATDTTLRTPESVLYDSAANILFVSNIDGKHDQKDGKGFISKVKLDGTIESLHWVKGLNAPKGMGMFGNKLYVTDIDKLVEIDVKAARILKSYPVKGAKFLNDVTVDADGSVYFSDTETNKIHLLKSGKVTEWMDSTEAAPNGLLVMDGKLYLATSNFSSIDLATKEVTSLGTGISAGDGVVYTGRQGVFIVSSWDGQVFVVSPEKGAEKILDTRESKMNTADIEYVKSQNLLLIPTFFNNRVVAYKVELN